MADYRPAQADRIRAGVPVAIVHVLLALVILRGFDAVPPIVPDDMLRLVNLAPEDVPPPVEEPPPPPPSTGSAAPNLRAADPRPEGAASPPNLKANPTPLVAPEPEIPPLSRSPIAAATTAGTGRDSSAGAAPVRGLGTGSGGFGTGTGSGRFGGGGGGGGGGTGAGWAVTPPRRVAGGLSIDDLPEPLRAAGFRGEVEVRYRVEADGRASDCRPIRSSGNRLVDETTCRLIERRFRFRPSRDAAGRPTHSFVEENHYYESEGDFIPPPPRRRGW
ncbi:MAG TPA: energy transducer TonB [Allosphingosinicella sp.]